ncbi:ribonuclease YeeF family protein [Metabacillus herbersteinensis]|uniref:Ribonuclease YeeF family protein n=1 Tax=Metabacillus herbersteinensis TaxID=283816 RepID=A0ABV6GHG0_9BACI
MATIKVYEAKTLISATEERAQQFKESREQVLRLKKQFHDVVNMGEFQGKGATAIKGFYQAQIDVAEAWLRLFDRNIAFFNGISSTTEDMDLAGSTVVEVPFLEEDLAIGIRRSKDIVAVQQEELQTILTSINDLVSLQVFSRDSFDDHMNEAEKERTEAIQKVITIDSDLKTEYSSSRSEEDYVISLFGQLIEATRQGGTISPINFNAQFYQNSEVYKLISEAEKQTNDYLTFKKEQKEAREIAEEMEELENRPWYEKAWDTIATFTGEVTGYYDSKRAAEGIDPITGQKLSDAERIAAGAMAAAGFIPVVGWAGRAFKGGSAIFKTVKATESATHALDAYKTTRSFSTLQKTEMGIYGLISANGLNEAVFGKDMFGNELTKEQRQQSLVQALGIIGVGGAAHAFDRMYAKTPSFKSINNERPVDKDAFKGKLNNVLKEKNLHLQSFNEMRLRPISSLTPAEVQKMKDIRRSVPPISKGTMMQKVLPPSAINWLFVQPRDGGQIKMGGFLAKASDTKELTSYDKIFEGLRLDYKGAPEWPNEFLTADSALALRFNAIEPENYKIPFGGNSKDDVAKMINGDETGDFIDELQGDPFTGNGFTKSEKYIIPEYENNIKLELYDGVELFEITNTGEKLIGVYSEQDRKFVSLLKGDLNERR